MLRDIEKSCLFLFQLANDSEFDLDTFLNHTTNDGSTLFFYASKYSETINRHLATEKDVQVNPIDELFIRPLFRGINAQANEILKRELTHKWTETTYEDIREDCYSFGFTCEYLFASANYDSLSSSAETSTLAKLATFDLQKGTSIPKLVFSCCKWFPMREATESLIKLRKENQTEEEVVKGIFGFQDHEGDNCLTVLFQMAVWYKLKNNAVFPSGPMLCDIEDTCLFLIQKAKSYKLDLAKILNHTTKHGNTLFSDASAYSETITKYLLAEKDVRVNSIDDKFLTPFTRV